MVCKGCYTNLPSGASVCEVCGKEPPSTPCPHCSAPVPEGRRFCPKCRGLVVDTTKPKEVILPEKTCPHCEKTVPSHRRYCKHCGLALPKEGETSTPKQEAKVKPPVPEEKRPSTPAVTEAPSPIQEKKPPKPIKNVEIKAEKPKTPTTPRRPKVEIPIIEKKKPETKAPTRVAKFPLVETPCPHCLGAVAVGRKFCPHCKKSVLPPEKEAPQPVPPVKSTAKPSPEPISPPPDTTEPVKKPKYCPQCFTTLTDGVCHYCEKPESPPSPVLAKKKVLSKKKMDLKMIFPGAVLVFALGLGISAFVQGGTSVPNLDSSLSSDLPPTQAEPTVPQTTPDMTPELPPDSPTLPPVTSSGSTIPQAYQPILTSYKYGLANSWTAEDYSATDLNPEMATLTPDTAGYALLDLDNNGTVELVIGSIEGGAVLMDLYTYDGDNLILLLRSYPDERYIIYQQGQIARWTSQNASPLTLTVSGSFLTIVSDQDIDPTNLEGRMTLTYTPLKNDI